MVKSRPDFDHRIRWDAGVLIVLLQGRLDRYAAGPFAKAMNGILEGDVGGVVFDCEKLSYMSVGGLRVVLAAARSMREQKGRFVLCNLAPDPMELFRLTDLHTVIPICDSVDAASAATRG